MRMSTTALLAPLAAAVVGWMLSGSPVPMALTLVIALAALFGGFFSRRLPRSGVASLLITILPAMAAFWIEWRLFRDGQALAMRADMPFAYHAGIALLWWAALDHFLRPRHGGSFAFPAGSFAALCGGLLIVGAAAGTILYDFGPWEVHPVAALPLVLWSIAAVGIPAKTRQGIVLVVLSGSLASAGLILVSTKATTTLKPWFFLDDSSTLDSGYVRAPGIGTRGPLGDNAARRLPREANLQFRREIVVRVKAHSPSLYRAWSESPLYLRTSTLALFESEEVLSPVRSGRWIYDTDDGEEDQRIVLKPGRGSFSTDPPSRLHTYYIDRRSINHLPFIEGTKTLYTPSVYEFADDWYQLSAAEEFQQIRYTAALSGEPVAALQAADLARRHPGEPPGIYLQMPPSPLSGKIREWCATFPDGDPLGSIRTELSARTTYSLRFNTPEGSSPLDEFLFGNGRGHCEHYASATVLMLRSLGIPARVAYGFAGGTSDPAQRLFAFRDSDFHAWAEVLTPDREWKVFDTTPRVASAAPRVPSSDALPILEDHPYHDLSEFDVTAAGRNRDWSETLHQSISWLSRHFLPASAIGLGLIFLLTRLLAARRRSRGEVEGKSPRHRTGREQIPAFLRELESIAASAGLKRTPGKTWRELLDQLAGRIPLPPTSVEAVRYHYRTTYAGGERDEANEIRFLECLRESRITGERSARD